MTQRPHPGVTPPQERAYTAVAMGLVGTGRTPSDAKRDLMEKIRQAGQS